MRPSNPPRRPSAFTLIELLVVIAIIAILAAILFPVFAQAKAAAKKSVSLSNTKQAATGIVLYTSDTDDTFPLAYTYNDQGNMIMGGGSGGYFLALVPADEKVFDKAPLEYIRWSRPMWANSCQPYMKSIEVTDTPFSINYTKAAWQAFSSQPISSLRRTHMTMNGLLNGWSATAINAPSFTPLLTFGNGKEGYNGFAYTNPYLYCRDRSAQSGACMFNPSGPSQTNSGSTTRGDTYEYSFVEANDTTWTHGEGTIVAATDSSAKFVKTPRKGFSTAPNSFAYEYRDTNGSASVGGYVYDPARCLSSGSTVPYLSYFRPDNNGSFKVGNSGMRVACE